MVGSSSERKSVQVLEGVSGRHAVNQLRLAQQALAQIRESVVITEPNIEEPGPAIVYVNEAFTRMTGYRAEEVIGRNPRFLQGPKTTRRTLDRLRRQLEKGEAFEGDDINYRKDGSEFHIDWYIEPLRDESGNIRYFVAVQRDVSEKRRLEKQLLQAQRLEGIGLLASGMAHDLNNILAPITMGTDALLQHGADAQTRSLLGMMQQSARRGVELVRQVLSFARGITGRSHSAPLRHVVEEVARMARSTFPKSITVRADEVGETWNAEVDPTQLYQILLNLCVNARDAIVTTGAITLTARNVTIENPVDLVQGRLEVGNYVLLRVHDTGSGMPPEVVAKIFDPFFTTKSEEKGTGLGLATVALIARNHRGAIDVQSAPDEGTTFSIYLPAIRPERSASASGARTIAQDGGGRLILIVDAEAALTEMMRETLVSASYRVSTAANLSEAQELIAQSRPDIVIADGALPDAGGEGIVRALRGESDLPVILINTPENAAPEDATAVLQKPFTLENLLIALHGAGETIAR